MRRSGGRGFILAAAILAAGHLGGCYATRPVKPEELRGLPQSVAVRIDPRDGEPFRALVGPTDLGPSSIRCRPLLHGPDGWVVRWGGWPIVYTAGKVLRFIPAGGTLELPLEEVEGLELERFSWPLTLLTLPVTFPPGVVDFVIHHMRMGFEEVDTSFDDFSRSSYYP